MPTDVRKDSTLSNYSVDHVNVIRLNKDQTVPCLKDFTYQEEDEQGNVVDVNVTGGIEGFLGTVDITSIEGATGVSLLFTVGDKQDEVPIDLSTIPDPTRATVDQVVTALNVSIGVKASFPNIGYPFIASKDAINRLRIKADVTDAEAKAASPTFLFAITDDPDSVDSPAATVLQLNNSYIRPIENTKTVSSAATTTESQEIENTDGKGVVTSIKTAEETTGYEITIEDAQSNPYNKAAITGGHYNAVDGVYSPKRKGVAPPSFALLTYSRTFEKGSFVDAGYTDVEMTIYPSCTGVQTANDKGEQEFNASSYDITAADGKEMAAGIHFYITKDEYLAVQAFTGFMTK